MNHPSILCTVDLLLFTIKGGKLCVGLHHRAVDPCKGLLALPGGFVRANEDKTVKHAALRVLREKVGSDKVYLEQLATFSGDDRDPRGYSVSIAYMAAVPQSYSDKNLAIEWVPVDEMPTDLPFKHNEIVDEGVARLRAKGLYSSIPVMFLSDRLFTLPELQTVYEVACGIVRDKVTFRRKILELNILKETDEKTEGALTKSRPAVLYTVRPKYLLEVENFDKTF